MAMDSYDLYSKITLLIVAISTGGSIVGIKWAKKNHYRAEGMIISSSLIMNSLFLLIFIRYMDKAQDDIAILYPFICFWNVCVFVLIFHVTIHEMLIKIELYRKVFLRFPPKKNIIDNFQNLPPIDIFDKEKISLKARNSIWNMGGYFNSRLTDEQILRDKFFRSCWNCINISKALSGPFWNSKDNLTVSALLYHLINMSDYAIKLNEAEKKVMGDISWEDIEKYEKCRAFSLYPITGVEIMATIDMLARSETVENYKNAMFSHWE